MELLHQKNSFGDDEYLFDVTEEQLRHRLERLNAFHTAKTRRADNKKAFDLGNLVISKYPDVPIDMLKKKLSAILDAEFIKEMMK